MVHAINAALGNIGKTVVFLDAPEAKEEKIADLAQALNSGQVETLVMLGGNPVYNAPADLSWAQAQRKARTWWTHEQRLASGGGAGERPRSPASIDCFRWKGGAGRIAN